MVERFARDQTGGQLQDRWQDWSREVFFPNEFVSHYPWGECPSLPNTEPVHVERLCHVTHTAQAQAITRDGRSTFNSHVKNGKCLFHQYEPGRSVGYSYRRNELVAPTPETNYEYVSAEQHLLPEGSYSWWGIDNNPNDSWYGTCNFSFNFLDMLRQFRTAHTTANNPNPAAIYFRKAGTLRYRREICYVVLVCANADLEDRPPLTEEDPHVTVNGMLDDTGRWNGGDINFAYNKRSYEGNDWEHLVFGFYFNQNIDHFDLENNADPPYNQIAHGMCIKRQRVHGRFVCPDEAVRVYPPNPYNDTMLLLADSSEDDSA